MTARLPARLPTTVALITAFLGLAAMPAKADIYGFSSLPGFAAAAPGAQVDGFSDLSPGDVGDSPMARSAGSIGYTVSTDHDSGGLYFGGNSADPYLSNGWSNEALTFSFATPVHAVALNTFGSAGGAFGGDTVTITATDSLGNTLTVSLDNTLADRSSFIGFGSTAPIVSLSVYDESSFYVGVDNLRIAATVSAVPEPASALLMALGGLGLAGLGWRRRSAAAQR